MVTGVNHVQITIPRDGLDVARQFYLGFLGLKEIRRPDVFTSQGLWLNAGSFEVHLGLEEGVNRTATRAHIAYEVADIAAARAKVEFAGMWIKDQPPFDGYVRFHTRDPFGNTLELIQKVS